MPLHSGTQELLAHQLVEEVEEQRLARHPVQRNLAIGGIERWCIDFLQTVGSAPAPLNAPSIGIALRILPFPGHDLDQTVGAPESECEVQAREILSPLSLGVLRDPAADVLLQVVPLSDLLLATISLAGLQPDQPDDNPAAIAFDDVAAAPYCQRFLLDQRP